MNHHRRLIYLLLLSGIIGGEHQLAAQSRYTGRQVRPHCQIIDRPADALFQAEAAYLYRADIDSDSATAMLEVAALANLAYFRWSFGDIDARGDFRGTWLIDSGPIHLPNQLLLTRFPLTWTGRYPQGLAARVTLKPGYYGDGEVAMSDALFMPVSLSVVRAFAADLSGVAGLEFRHGFERKWFPVFGMVWQPFPDLRVEALLPRGMVSLALSRDWRVHAAYAWESLDYRLHTTHRQLTIEDIRLSVGATRVLHSELELTAEIGYVTERQMKFRRPSGSRLDPDDALLIRFGLAAPF